MYRKRQAESKSDILKGLIFAFIFIYVTYVQIEKSTRFKNKFKTQRFVSYSHRQGHVDYKNSSVSKLVFNLMLEKIHFCIWY